MNHLAPFRLCHCGVVHKPDTTRLLGLRPLLTMMAAATVRASIATGAGPTLATAESGYKYNREDTASGTTPIPIPTSTGTNYSWLKWLCLEVTASGTTAISNRRVQLSTSETSGLGIFFQGNATYAQAASGNMPTASGSNGPATPAGFTRASTSAQVYDSASVSSGSTGRNGSYCETVLGVDSTYAGGAGNAIALPDVRLIYDEA
jgi:hypothetical protein